MWMSIHVPQTPGRTMSEARVRRCCNEHVAIRDSLQLNVFGSPNEVRNFEPDIQVIVVNSHGCERIE